MARDAAGSCVAPRRLETRSARAPGRAASNGVRRCDRSGNRRCRIARSVSAASRISRRVVFRYRRDDRKLRIPVPTLPPDFVLGLPRRWLDLPLALGPERLAQLALEDLAGRRAWQ